MRLHAIQSFSGDLNAGETTTLEVDLSDDEVSEVVTILDDGTVGNNPPTYDLEQHVELPLDADGFRFYDEVTGETARSWTDPAYGQTHRVNVTNQSGGTATFRIVLLALSQG